MPLATDQPTARQLLHLAGVDPGQLGTGEVVDRVLDETVPIAESHLAEIVDSAKEAKAAAKQWYPPKRLRTSFSGTLPARKILADNAVAYIEGLNHDINEAHRQYGKLEEKSPVAAARYLEIAIRAQVRALTITVGTTVRVEKADGQDSVKRWDTYPIEVREAFARFLDVAGRNGVDVSSLVGARPVNALPS